MGDTHVIPPDRFEVLGDRVSEYDGPVFFGEDRDDEEDDEDGEDEQDGHDEEDGHDGENDLEVMNGDAGDGGDMDVAVTPPHPSQREFVTRKGISFGNNKVHRTIRHIFDQHFDGPWPTFRKVPKDVRARMFNRFKARYQWNPLDDHVIEETFINQLKICYPDIIRTFRAYSANEARNAGLFIPKGKNNFQIMRDYSPPLVDLEAWRALCSEIWDTPEWSKKSEVGRKNRNGSSGATAMHTGGSRGFVKTRTMLDKGLGRTADQVEFFCHTHLTKESKEKFWAREYNTIDDLDFCTPKAKNALIVFKDDMVKKYGKDLDKHLVADPDLWAHRHGGKGKRTYGVGSSDLHYVMTGKRSSGSLGSNADYERSQREVRKLQSKVKVLESNMDKHLQAMEKQIADKMEKHLAEKLENHIQHSNDACIIINICTTLNLG